MQYLYNGTQLPDIYTVYTPELQKQYPFAVIDKGILGYGDFYTLRAFAENAYYLNDNAAFGGDSDGTHVPAFTSRLNAGDTAWGEPKFLENSNAVQAGTVWTNFDWVRANGNIFMAASDPVPVTTINPSALMQGFFVGQAIRRMRGVQPEKKLVGYLYGGVGPLPDVNEAYESFAAVAGVDVETVKSIAPYAVLFHLDTATLLHLCTKLPYVDGDDCWMPDGGGIAYFIVDGKAWTMASSSNNDYGEDIAFMKKVGIVWTSHNILTADGSTYLAASEPVPVYE